MVILELFDDGDVSLRYTSTIHCSRYDGIQRIVDNRTTILTPISARSGDDI
jgi:hypothetical protein